MLEFAGLLLAHLLYDFHWQGPFIAENKGKRWFLLAVHALTWALLLGAVEWGFGKPHLLARVLFLFIAHYIADRWKAKQPRDDAHWNLIYVDQATHLATIILLVLWRV